MKIGNIFRNSMPSEMKQYLQNLDTDNIMLKFGWDALS